MPEPKLTPLSQECSKDHYTAEKGSLQALEQQLADAQNVNIQLKRRISELLQNFRNSKMSIHHTDPPEDLERMNSDELLNTIRNSTMQMSIDFITKGTTSDEIRQSCELQY